MSASGAPGAFTLSNLAPVWDTVSPAGPAVQLNWTASSGAASYDLYRDGSFYKNVTGTSFYNSTGLTSGQTYTYYVVAKNSTGTTKSNTATVGPMPSAPVSGPGAFTLSNLAPVWDTVSPAGPAVQLNWTASSGAASYDVYRDGAFYKNVTGTSFYNNAGLTSGQTYTYYVVAKNSTGTTKSNTVTVGPMPSAPASGPGTFTLSNLAPVWDTGSPAGPAVQLNWTASSDAVSYDVYRDGSFYKNVTGTSFYNNAGLTSGQTYTYYVVAKNSTGTTKSNTVTVGPMPSAPASGPGAFTLSNLAPVWDTGSPAGPAVQLNWTASSDAASYDVYRDGAFYKNVTGTSFYNNAGLTSGQTYTYYVVAKNSTGTTKSNTVTVGPMPSAPASGPGTFTLSNLAPVWDAGSPAGPAVQLNWTASSGAASYDVYRDDSFYKNVTGTSFYNNTGLKSGETYTYYVVAKNSAGTTKSNTLMVGPMPDALPTIVSISSDVRISQGESAVLSVVATGGSLTYEWRKDGKSFVGASNASELRIANASPLNSGSYTVNVTNSAGSRLSQPIQLVVEANANSTPALSPPKQAILMPYGDIDPRRATVVITHGLEFGEFNPSEPVDWTSTMAQKVQEFTKGHGVKVNIFYYKWPDAYTNIYAQALFFPALTRADLSVAHNATTLANLLIDKLGNDYAQPIHFIGHSLGTFVNAQAIALLKEKMPKANQIQVTIFDAPMTLPGHTQALFQNNLPAETVRWVENYYGSNQSLINNLPAVGGPITGAAPNGGEQTSGGHSGPYEWYLAGERFPTYFGKSIVLPGFETNDRSLPRRWDPHPITIGISSVVNIEISSLVSTAATATGIVQSTAESIGNGTLQRYLNFINQAGTGLYNVVKLIEGGSSTGSRIVAAYSAERKANATASVSDSSLSINVTIPTGATKMILPYHFGNKGDGDWLSVTFNNEQLLAVRGDNLATADWQIEEFSTASLAGSSGTLVIRLNGVGAPNADLTLGGLTFITPTLPEVLAQPTATTVEEGKETMLSIQAGGVGPLTYQWRRNGTPLAGANASTLTLNNVTAASAGDYDVVVTNGNGSTTSMSVRLTVTPSVTKASGSKIGNIAARAYCGTGDNVAIGGFVISGDTPRRVLVRAIGPSLANQGIPASELLPDPTIEVHDAHGVLASNDNWTDNWNASEIASVAAQIGASPFSNGDFKSSALLLLLQPGVYSFVVKGVGAGSGIVLLEVYDANLTASGSSLVNIAARSFCSTGNGVTIGGFVISGNTPKQILVRAVGPTLATLGINADNVLQDPAIELHDANHGNGVIASNDNWGDNPNAASIITTGGRIGAVPLASNDTRSSALLLTLQPGVYTFVASGKSSGSGIVLVEVYDAD